MTLGPGATTHTVLQIVDVTSFPPAKCRPVTATDLTVYTPGRFTATDVLTLGTFTGPAGTFRQTAGLTPAQRGILASLQIPCPKKIIQAAPAGSGHDRTSA